ncbi:MAG: acetate uptake transporter [Actinomycetales bacterium]
MSNEAAYSSDIQGSQRNRASNPDPTSPPLATPPPFADPAALGLGAFAMTTFVLSVVNAGWLPATVEPVVFGLALFFGGVAQFAAGIWEFANRNTFGATAFCSYGAFWMAYWFLARFTDLSGAGADAAKGVGVFLLGWAIFTIYMTVAAWRTNMAVFLVFVFLSVTFLALAFGALTATTGLTRIGGYLGVVTALIAWYASFAVVANFTYKRAMIPVGPR